MISVLRLARRASVVVWLLALCACTREPTEAELRPPPDWRESWTAAVVQGRATASRAARAAADQSAERLRSSKIPPQAAPALAAAIRHSRRQARASGLEDPPPHVRAALAPYFPAEMLEQVGWTLPGDDVSLGSLLSGWYFDEGAVALQDVIVFSNRRLAQNVWFWAHELTHVEQYKRLGVDGFARQYVADWRKLELEATQRADRITADIRARREAAAQGVAEPAGAEPT